MQSSLPKPVKKEARLLDASPKPKLKTTEVSSPRIEAPFGKPSKYSRELLRGGIRYQGIGVIQGDVFADNNNCAYVQVGQTEYRLFGTQRYNESRLLDYTSRMRVMGYTPYLLVYPEISLPAKRSPDYQDSSKMRINFRVVRISREIKKDWAPVNFFRLAGIWQVLEISDVPCISIYRNQSRFEGDPCRANHVPVHWEEGPAPFLYDPQNRRKKEFYEILAEYDPASNQFSFRQLLGASPHKVPFYVKPNKDAIFVGGGKT